MHVACTTARATYDYRNLSLNTTKCFEINHFKDILLLMKNLSHMLWKEYLPSLEYLAISQSLSVA